MADKKSDGKVKVKVKVTVHLPKTKHATMSDRMKGTLKKLGK